MYLVLIDRENCKETPLVPVVRLCRRWFSGSMPTPFPFLILVFLIPNKSSSLLH